VIRFWRRRRRSLLGAVVAAAGILTIAGCASSARAGAGAVPPLQIDYPDFELTPIPGSSIPIPDNAVPFDVATSPLPTASQSAEVWTWPAGPASARDVKTLAKELGLDGDPPRVADGWQVGTATAMVRVYDDPGWPWSYTTSKTPVSWTVCIAGGNFGPYFNCDNNPPSPPPSPTGSPSPQPTISAPGLDQAPSIAKPLLTALGVTGPISVSSIGRDGITTLDVPPSVQGMPTNGFRVWIQVDSTGVVTASGWLATPKPGAVYPLISAMQAFDLSNGWTGGFCAAAAVAPTSAARRCPELPTAESSERDRCCSRARSGMAEQAADPAAGVVLRCRRHRRSGAGNCGDRPRVPARTADLQHARHAPAEHAAIALTLTGGSGHAAKHQRHSLRRIRLCFLGLR